MKELLRLALLIPLLVAVWSFEVVASPDAVIATPTKINFKHSDKKSIKAMAEKIRRDTVIGLNGYISLSWHHREWRQPALQLRQQLLRKGFTTSQILMLDEMKSLKVDHQEGLGIVISYMTVPMERESCHYEKMNWRYSSSNYMGCANKVNLKRARQGSAGPTF